MLMTGGYETENRKSRDKHGDDEGTSITRRQQEMMKQGQHDKGWTGYIAITTARIKKRFAEDDGSSPE
jgi:hypothetical protein